MKDLQTVMDIFITPLRGEVGKRFPELFSAKTGAVTVRCRFAQSIIKVVFSTIELILDGNTELYAKLRKEVDNNPSPAIGSVFVENIDSLCQYYGVFFIHLYDRKVFCNHQGDAMNQIEELLKTPQFKEFEDSCKVRVSHVLTRTGIGKARACRLPYQAFPKATEISTSFKCK